MDGVGQPETGQLGRGLTQSGVPQPAFRNAVDERAWRHQQLARSLQTGGTTQGDADFAFALQLALEDEAVTPPAPGPLPRPRSAAAVIPHRTAHAPASPATPIRPPTISSAKKKSYFRSLKESLQGRRHAGNPAPEELSPLPSPVPSTTSGTASRPHSHTEMISPLPHHAEDHWEPPAAAAGAYTTPPRGGRGASGVAVRQSEFMPPPSERNTSARNLSRRQLPEAEERGGNLDSPRSGAIPDLRSSAAELTHDHNGDELDEAMQEPQAQADYVALLQDSRLLRRDIAQATADRQIQKEDLERQSKELNAAMRQSTRYVDSSSGEDAFLRLTEQHARIEKDHRLVVRQIGALQRASVDLRKLDGFVQSSKPPAALATELQDAIIREYLGRLSVVGVILLDLPPEVAASYAAPHDVAGGARISEQGSSHGVAPRSSTETDSQLRQVLRSPEIDMAAAMAVIQRQYQRQASVRAGPSHGVPMSRHGSGTSHSREFPSTSNRSSASANQQLLQQGTEQQLGAALVRGSSGSGTALEAQFSFSQPRETSFQSTASMRNGLSTSSSGDLSPASHPLNRVSSQQLSRLRSVDSDAKEAAELLLADLSASDDDSDVPHDAYTSNDAPDAASHRQEAEAQRQQQEAEDEAFAAATAAALAATAAAAAERHRAEKRQARLGEERARAEQRAQEVDAARADAEAAALAEEGRAEVKRQAEARAEREHMESQRRAQKATALAEARDALVQAQQRAAEAHTAAECEREAAAAEARRTESAAAAAAEMHANQLQLAQAELAETEARIAEQASAQFSTSDAGQNVPLGSSTADVGRHTAEDVSPRSSSPPTVPVEVEAELRMAAGVAVAAAFASGRPPPSPPAAVDEGRATERQKREERQAALAAQKRDIQSRRQRRLSAQPDMSGFPNSPSPLKAVLKTPPGGVSPEPSPPRSPVSAKSVTFAPVPVVASEAPSTISSSSSGSRSSMQAGNGATHTSRAARSDRGGDGTHRSPRISQRQEEEDRMQRIEKEFAMMELQALMARHGPSGGSSSGRRSRASSSRGGSVDGDRSPEGSSLRGERASSVTGSEGRHHRRRSSSEVNDMMVYGGEYPVGQDRGRHYQNGGIPAIATMSGGRRSSAPEAISPQLRPQAESPGPAGSSPRSAPASKAFPGAAQNTEAGRRPAAPFNGTEVVQSVKADRMPPLQLSPKVQAAEGTGAGVKAASAWTAALDAMAMARRKKGTSGPAHLAGASPQLTGRISPESAAASRQADAALAAQVAAEKLQGERALQSKLALEHDVPIKRLAADVERFKATNMAELAAFMRRAKAQVPSALSEATLLQMGWPGAKWRVMSAAISAWQEVAQMTDAQLAWQMLNEFPLSDEAMRLETYFDIVEHSPADLDAAAKDQKFRMHGIPWDPEVYTPLRLASLNLAKIYMESTLSEASKVAPGSSTSRVDGAISHLVGSSRLTMRVQKFAGGLNRECASLLTSVRQMQNSFE